MQENFKRIDSMADCMNGMKKESASVDDEQAKNAIKCSMKEMLLN